MQPLCKGTQGKAQSQPLQTGCNSQTSTIEILLSNVEDCKEKKHSS